MALINPIQPTFGGGEYAPSLYPRVDTERYRIGLKTCRNFLIHPHGGASNRPGTKYIASAKYADKLCILRPFIFSDSQAYTLEIGDHYIRFYTNQAQIQATVPDEWTSTTAYVVDDYVTYASAMYRCIQDNTNKQPDTETDYWTAQTAYEIYTPYAEADLRLLQLESSADVIFITHPDYQPMTLSRLGNATWELEAYAPTDGPFMAENILPIYLLPEDVDGTIAITANANLFDADHVGALWKLRHYIEGQTDSQSFTGTGTGTGIKCFTTWRVISHGTWKGKFRIEKSSDGGSTWTTLRSFTSKDDYNANTSGTEDIDTNEEPFLVRVNMYAHTSGTCNVDLTTDSFYQDGIVQIESLISASEVTATVISELGIAALTYSWNEGSWSNYRGWPSVSRFYQDRLCFAGSPYEPMTIWMTQTGNYYSFLRHTTLLDTDGITTNLPSRQLNAINGLMALKKLVAFTSSSEWTIGSSGGSVLTPNTLEQSLEEYRGSNGTVPAVVGNEIIFVQANGKVIRNLLYDGFDGFVGTQLNVFSKHLFDRWNIIELAYQQDPDSIVWALRDDGVLLGMTYMREQEVVAWFWVDTGTVAGNDKAEIESIATIPGDGYDELWMAVKRGDKRFIELMSKRIVESDCVTGGKQYLIENSYFVDCGVTVGANPVYITSITVGASLLITAPSHGFTNGDVVRFDNIPEYDFLEGKSYIVESATTDTFEVSTEVT